MRMYVSQLLCILLLTLSFWAVGQSNTRVSYRAVVHLTNGGRISGVLDEVADGKLAFVPSEPIYFRHTTAESYVLALNRIDRVVLKRLDKRRAIRTGFILGGLTGGYLTYRSNQRNPYRSPLLGVTAVILGAGASGVVGGFVGSLFGGSSRRVIRPSNGNDPVESLEKQLRPFTQVYQDDLQRNVQ